MKKTFDVPLIFLTAASPMDGQGPGSLPGGQDKVKPVPCRFDEWQQSRWFGDYDRNGVIDINDYAKWWARNGFTVDTWNQYNPGVSWKDEWIQ